MFARGELVEIDADPDEAQQRREWDAEADQGGDAARGTWVGEGAETVPRGDEQEEHSCRQDGFLHVEALDQVGDGGERGQDGGKQPGTELAASQPACEQHEDHASGQGPGRRGCGEHERHRLGDEEGAVVERGGGRADQGDDPDQPHESRDARGSAQPVPGPRASWLRRGLVVALGGGRAGQPVRGVGGDPDAAGGARERSIPACRCDRPSVSPWSGESVEGVLAPACASPHATYLTTTPCRRLVARAMPVGSVPSTMIVGLACATGTSLCYGIGSVLQAVAAAEADSVPRLDPLLLLRLVRAWRYVLGLALDGVGFVLSLVALRSLPLYAVQAIVASFLAVTAVVGALFLGVRLRRIEWAALAVVVLGLVLVGFSAASQSARASGTWVSWLLLATALALALVSIPSGRVSGARGAALLGSVAGLAFGIVAVGARALSSSAVHGTLVPPVHVLVSSPASYAVLVSAPLALVTYATALQRGSVVQATAPLVVGETVLPALVGLAFLGDHARPGWETAALAGFVLAVLGALLLSRFGEVEVPPAVGDLSR